MTRLGTELSGGAAARAGVTPEQLLRAPAAVARFPADVVEAVRDALSASLHWVFVGALPLAVGAFVAALLLRELPLRTSTHVEQPTEVDARETARV